MLASVMLVVNECAFLCSTCLKGKYMHKLWAINTDDPTSRHFRFERQKGGVYFEAEQAPGQLTTALCQPFETGQSLFVSAVAQHSVAIEDTPCTLVVKGKSRQCPTYVRSAKPDIAQAHEAVTTYEAASPARQGVIDRFIEALESFQSHKERAWR